MNIPEANDAISLFSEYLRVTGVAHTDPEPGGDPALIGKRLGLINGSSWITLWANYFGRQYLPGVHLVNVGNEAVQINFMQAHRDRKPVPPQENISAFVQYARDLVQLAQVDFVLITCSTMNRAYSHVASALEPFGVQVLQIDRPMMESAVLNGGRVLVISTHGPTTASTQMLLQETASDLDREVAFTGLDIQAAWKRLVAGDVAGHNQILAEAIHAELERSDYGCVVLAQLSMTVFLLSYPDPIAEFGLPILTSGQCGFEAVRAILLTG